MRPITFILALLLVLCAAGVGAYVSWSNPDMTNRRLWLEYPGTLGACATAALVGMALLGWVASKK